MIIQLPRLNHLAAAVAAGPVRRAQPPRYAVVLKGSYRLAHPDGTGTRPMLPAATAQHAAIAYADEPEGGEATGYQADLALRKERCDIVVAGWLAGPPAGAPGMEGDIALGAQTWFSRATLDAGAVPEDLDAVRNLFGWQPRTAPPRLIEPRPGNTDPLLPAGYTAQFENAYRRSGTPPGSPQFTTPADRNTGSLPAATEVRLRQWRHGTPGDAVQYRLRSPAALGFSAQLRAWCGHGPDQARHWRLVDRLALRCDTLVIYPQHHRAVVLWRADWDAQLVPLAHWRLVQITEGSG